MLGVAWLMLLAVQPLLIRFALRPTHRRLGRLGVIVGAAFAISGMFVAHRSLNLMNAEQFARDGRHVYLPLAMTTIFAAALAMAVHFRTAPAMHARFMAATVLPLLDPVIARLLFTHAPPLPAMYLYQVPAFAGVFVALAWLAQSAPRASQGRLAFAWFSVATMLLLVGFFVIPALGPWQAFIAWFRAWPIT